MHLHEELDAVERRGDGLGGGAGDGSGGEESGVTGHDGEGGEGVLEELGRRGHEIVVQFGLRHGDGGEFRAAGGGGESEGGGGVATEAGLNGVVFEVGNFAPRECGSLLCGGRGNRHYWERR